MTRRCLPSAVSEEPIDMEAKPAISTNHDGNLPERLIGIFCGINGLKACAP
jgi:hypothetical protein